MLRLPAAAVLLTAAVATAQGPSSPAFVTKDGPVAVKDWGYQLQGHETAAVAAAPHDLIVVDFARHGDDASRFTQDEVAAMQLRSEGGRRVVVAYLSIGESSEFRAHWRRQWTRTGRARSPLTQSAPVWLGPVNPDWPESRKVRYWDPAWQAIIFNGERTGWLDQIVAQGFDGAYLDIVDAYYFWGAEAKERDRCDDDPVDQQDAARRMAAFVVAFTAHARQVNPQFFSIPQNGEFLLNDLRHGKRPQPGDAQLAADYLDAISAIAIEDTYYRGDEDENNPLAADDEKVVILQADFLKAGKPVLLVDYINEVRLVEDFHHRARADGFIPYAAPSRGLDRLGPPSPVE
jgi:cysteinyl-tRNA synthetase